MTRHKIFSAIGGLAILLAIFLLYRVFRNQDPAALREAVTSVSLDTLMLAGLLTAGSFVAISVLEYLAVRHTHAPISVRRIVATAFAAIGIGHTVGLAALSSGAIRYRMYGRAGLGILFVGKVLLFSGISTACGFAGIGGIALLWRAESLAPLLGIAPEMVRGVGAGLLSVLAAYLITCVILPSRVVAIGKKITIRIPSGRVATLQILSANTNVLCIVGALYACLRDFTDVTYSMIAALYVSSDMMALIGHVPGGWGVLEYIITTSLDGGDVLAGVVLFRAVYYLVPLVLGLFIFLIDEIISYRKHDEEIPSSNPVTNAT
ncbi:MAG: hypothetical protein K0Q70_949 [Rhodospirillales bacterium]|nr:hypothetical protein [Rhodospirillales bacterium]